MKTLVTGGSGFIGSHLVDRLLEQGREVKVLVRQGSKHLDRVQNKQVEVIFGDVRNKGECKKAVEDCEVVYHLAAVLGATVKSERDYLEVNVRGTENIVQASLNEGVKRLVCCSSIAAIGNDHEEQPIRDHFPYKPVGGYAESKMMQEKIAFKALEENGLKTSCPRPGMVFGPRDDVANTHFFRLVRKRIFPIIGEGKKQLSFVFVENVADGLILGERKKAVGQGFFITQEPITLKDFAYTVSEEFGVGKPISIPFWLAYYSIFPVEKVARLFGIDLPINTRRLERLNQSHVFSFEKAKKLLGYVPKISMKEGIKRTVKWLKEN